MGSDSPGTRNPAPRTRAMLVAAAMIAAAAMAPGGPARAAAGLPRFFNYTSPPGVGDDSGEPSIGSNWTREQVFNNSRGPMPNGGSTNYFGGFSPYMLNVIFNDCQSPALVTWNQKTLLTANTPRVYGDPILFTDKVTGRTFVTQEEGLTPAGSTTDITDDDGTTFLPSQGSGAPSCVDHETVGGGPFHAPLTGTVYPNAIYYASQCVADASIAVSLDGGLTFGGSVPMFTVADCAGLHGHIKVASDGTVYVPDKSCGGNLPFHDGGQAAVIVSEDNGLTWAIRPVPGSTSMVDDDASVGVATNGNIYLGWQSADGHPRIAMSTTKGVSWAPIHDVGASLGIQNCAFPEVVAGDGDRAAFSFYGTTTAGAYDQPDFPGIWYLYVATTFDGGATWTMQNLTPDDPIQRGGICGGGACRNQLDFYDITIDKEGRILIGWDDGCVGSCVNGPPNSFASKCVISRQSGGQRLLAAFDPVEPATPEAPGPSGSVNNGVAHLSWEAPDNGGSPITGYNIYKRIGTGGSFNLVGTSTGTTFSESVNPNDQIYYRVTALNALGEGPYCHEFTLGAPPPTPCLVPGVLATGDVNSDGTDNDSGQNTPPDPTVNIKGLSVAEPYLGAGVNQLVFTLQVAPAGALGVPASSQWYIVWNRHTIAADGSDRRFVAMKTDASGAQSFVYGNFGPPLPLDGSLPAPNANTPTPLGNADFGSYDPASGEITIKLATSKSDDTPMGPGSDLGAINVRTYLARPDAGQKSQNNASDITGDGSYTLVGNGSCFCYVDQPPVARLSASTATGAAPLTVTFDASASSDPDVADGDAVGSYTFDFGDGSAAVTQSTPTISHTYATPSGSSGYFATLSVTDQKCSTKSLNVASANINVVSGAGVGDNKIPLFFRIRPELNPARGAMSFALDLDKSGTVSMEMFGADGRRVADVTHAWLPAGTHTVKWNGLDRSGRPAPPGVYMVRAKAGEHVTLTRVVLVR
jgi:PKD domain-containing protein/flagellar hook capping protein FlgD